MRIPDSAPPRQPDRRLTFMHPLERKIERLLRDHALLRSGQTVVAGVSAGPDSMALLHLLGALAPAWAVTLVAVYVDHGLRPAAAAAEAEAVRRAAARLGAGFVAATVDVRGLARRQGLSLEHAGRLLRYQTFERVAAETGAARIAVGHTADEQAEEVLLRLVRGSGRKGLGGMALFREGKVIRPLLDTTKAELLAYLADRGIPHLVDASNRDRRFLRNRLRLDLLPLLARDFNPNIGEGLRRTAAILRDEEDLLARLVDAAWGQVVTAAAPGEVCLRLAPFLDQPVALRRRLLERACWQMETAPSFRGIAQLLRLAEGQGPGCSGHLGDGLRVRREGGRLVFSRPRGRGRWRGDPSLPGPAAFAVTVPAPGSYLVAELGLRLEVAVSDRVAPLPPPAGEEWLDGEAVVFPFTVRSPLPGDRFHPLGAPGHKKVGDFLTDHKVPRGQRWRVPVLVSGGRVAALLGLRIDHGVRLTPQSRRLVKIRLDSL